MWSASAGSISETFDLVLLAVKAYGLDGAMRDMAPAIGPATLILPVLNGMSSSAFGAERVLGGMALICATIARRSAAAADPRLRKPSRNSPGGVERSPYQYGSSQPSST
jgi:ketopantoate reductase